MPVFEGMPSPARYWSALAIWLALTMAVLDGAIANVALPTIARELSATPAYAVWVVNGYQLAIVVSLLPVAALGEEIGYRRIFLGGIIAFTAASAACALAQSLPMLIFTRVIQGLGAAGIMSVNGALLRFTYPPNLLGRGVGLNALVVSAAAAFGPTVASGVLALGPWEWLFAINVPIGVVTFFIGRKSLPTNPKEGKFDIISTCLNVLTFGLGFTGIDALTRGGDAWFGSAELVLATLSGVALIWRSNAQPRPLAPIDLLKNKLFAMSVVTSIASFSAQMLAFVSLPFYLQGILHRSQVETGLLMTPWPVAAGVAAFIAGQLADKFSAAILSAAGLAILGFRASFNGPSAHRDDGVRDCGIDGDLRAGFRLFPVAEQSHHAFGGSVAAKRRGGRDARNIEAHRSNARRDDCRNHVSFGGSCRVDRSRCRCLVRLRGRFGQFIASSL